MAALLLPVPFEVTWALFGPPVPDVEVTCALALRVELRLTVAPISTPALAPNCCKFALPSTAPLFVVAPTVSSESVTNAEPENATGPVLNSSA